MPRDGLLLVAIPLFLAVAGGIVWRVRMSRPRGAFAAPGAAARGERSGWEMVSGIVALVVGVLALGVTSYTAYLQRRQAQAAVWPRVVLGHSDLPNFRIILMNKGVGPAMIRYVELRLDDRPVGTWEEALGVTPADYEYSSIAHRVLTPGESIDAFTLHNEALRPAVQSASRRLHGKICYCSIFDECWLFDDSPEDDVHSVPECPAPGPSSFKE